MLDSPYLRPKATNERVSRLLQLSQSLIDGIPRRYGTHVPAHTVQNGQLHDTKQTSAALHVVPGAQSTFDVQSPHSRGTQNPAQTSHSGHSHHGRQS